MRYAVPAIAMLSMLAACSSNTPRTAEVPPPPPRGTQASASAPEDCVDLARIRESRVVDDRTIDFVMRDDAMRPCEAVCNPSRIQVTQKPLTARSGAFSFPAEAKKCKPIH